MRRVHPATLLGGLIAFLVPFAVYLRTMSRTLNFWDCGEFITCSYILGIPHPPATPMYVLVGRLASLIPIGDGVAHRINMMSALFGALAALLMYMVILKAVRLGDKLGKPDDFRFWLRAGGALAAALFLAFSDTFWGNSIEAEVYSLSAFLMGGVTWLVLDWYEKADRPGGNALVYLILYLLALGVGFHLGTILVFPGFFLLALLVRKKGFGDQELWAVGLALAFFLGSAIMHWPDPWMFAGILLVLAWAIWLAIKGKPFALIGMGLFFLGLSVHVFLLIRAGQNPAINEADPSNWANLWAVLKREQYPFRSIAVREAPFGWQLSHFWGYLWQQFRMPFQGRLLGLNPGAALMALPFGLALIGLWQQWRRERKVFLAIFVILLVNTMGLILFLNFTMDEVRDRDYFYTGGFYYLAIFLGLGAIGLLEGFLQERKGRVLAGAVTVMLLVLSVLPMVSHWESHDRSQNQIARDYAYNMLAPLDDNAVIFTNGDNDTFPLWYIQEVEGFRKDVRVVNLSLLNTDWYVRQLRDQEPRLPIRYMDAELAEIATHYYQMETGRIFQPRDEIINHLFVNTRAEGWDTRSYYFAVTVPRDTLKHLEDYLVMEGMVYRMTLEQGRERVDMARLAENLEKTFIWRGIFPDWGSEGGLEDDIALTGDWSQAKRLAGVQGVIPAFPERPEVPFYRGPTIDHLIQNYAVAWSRYAIELDRGLEVERNPEKAIEAMQRAWLVNPDFGPAVNFLGYLYMKAGAMDEALEAYEHFARTDPTDFRFWARYAQALESAGRHEQVIDALAHVIDLNEDYEPALTSLVDYIMAYFPTKKNVMAVRGHLVRFLERHPESPLIRGRLEQLDQLVAEATRPEGEGP